MNAPKLLSVLAVGLAMVGMARGQQTDPSNKPSVTYGNTPKPGKESPYRTIEGIVKDASDNPAAGALVQLKDTKTAKVVDFPTKDDGKFVFRELNMDTNYELLAKRGDITTPVKKVTTYDTRKNVIVNFQLEPPKKQ